MQVDKAELFYLNNMEELMICIHLLYQMDFVKLFEYKNKLMKIMYIIIYIMIFRCNNKCFIM